MVSNKNLNINAHTYGHLIFDKEARNIHQTKESSTNGASQTECLMLKSTINLNSVLCTNSISNIPKTPIKKKTLKLIEEKLRNTLKLRRRLPEQDISSTGTKIKN